MRVDQPVHWLIVLAALLTGVAVALDQPLIAIAVLLAALLLAGSPTGRRETRRRRRRRSSRSPAVPQRRAEFLVELADRERALEGLRDARADRSARPRA